MRFLKQLAAAAIAIFWLAGCGNDPKAANDSNFTNAINAGLDKPGAAMICLSNVPRFPGQMSDQFSYGGAPDTSRYEAFVKAGLAQERTTMGTQPATYFAPAKRFHIHEYRLSTTGIANATTQRDFLLGDHTSFCYASYRVDHIVNFTEPEDLMGMRVTQVRWIPKVVNVAEWAKTDKVTGSLPDIKQNLDSLTTQERTTALTLTNTGWEVAR